MYNFVQKYFAQIVHFGIDNNNYSGKSKNDLDAIKKVTNDSTMTWQKFKQERYKLMEDS